MKITYSQSVFDGINLGALFLFFILSKCIRI
jgi:hypothetical protein